MMSGKNQVSRRRFLKEAAVAAPAMAAANTLGAQERSTQAPEWDKEADVVVIGTGFAGLSAAVTAKDAGAKVLILEKMQQKYEGGNSRVSGNMWWTPTNLPDALEYMEALCAGLTDRESLQALAEEMLELNVWLESLGVKPQPLGMFQPEHPELPGSKCVRTWSNGGAGGGRLWIPIREQVEKRGIEILYETPAEDLVLSPAREVLGVRATAEGKQISIKAARGVVLACGGFEFDFEMQKQFLPGWPTYLWKRNSGQHGRWNQNGAKGRCGALAHEQFIGRNRLYYCARVRSRHDPRKPSQKRLHPGGQNRETLHE